MNKEEIYYKKTPVSELPKEEGYYVAMNSDGYAYTAYFGGEWSHGNVDTYLQPVEVVDPGEFAEWASGNGWTFDLSCTRWVRFEAYNDRRKLTTAELLDLFKEQKQNKTP